MSDVAAALLPIFGAIAIGWLVRRTGAVPEHYWPGINKLSFNALIPALLFASISTAEMDLGAALPFLIAATLGFVVMGAISMTALLLPVDGPTFTSLFQGGVRWNGFVMLALAASVFGPEGVTLAALVFAPTVPVINIMCVAVLTIWGKSDRKPDAAQVLTRIAINPLILACLAGIAANALGLFQAGPIADTAELVGRAALALILLAIGAGLNFTALKAQPGLLALSSSLKLIVSPLVFFALGLAIGLEGMELAILVGIGATPGAAVAYVLASEMGGNSKLMAGHVTATTLLGLIALPFWIGFAGG